VSEEVDEATETVRNFQDLYKKISGYLDPSKNKSDTDVAFKILKFQPVGRKRKNRFSMNTKKRSEKIGVC